jgi:aromatic-L-amino-acid/L-tryptophan decarboxylase
VRASPVLELVTEPSLALSVVRVAPPAGRSPDAPGLNMLNRTFWERVSAHPEVYFTQTDLNGVFCVRFAVGSWMTTEEHVRKAFEVLEHEAEEVVRLSEGTAHA